MKAKKTQASRTVTLTLTRTQLEKLEHLIGYHSGKFWDIDRRMEDEMVSKKQFRRLQKKAGRHMAIVNALQPLLSKRPEALG